MLKKKKIGIREQEFAAEIKQILDLYYCQDFTFETTAEIVYGNKKHWCKVRRRKEKFINKLVEKLKIIWQKNEPDLSLTQEVIETRKAAINQLPKEVFANLVTQALKEIEGRNRK